MFLDDVVKAHQYASQRIEGGIMPDEPDLKDAVDRLSEVAFSLLENVVEDTEAPEERRYAAALAQYTTSDLNAAAFHEAVKNDPLLRSLLVDGMAKEDRTNWRRYGIVGEDCMHELARLLDNE